MGSLFRFNLRHLRQTFQLERLVETGTGRGDSLAWALRSGFPELYSVELAEPLFKACQQRFSAFPQVHLAQGASGDFLRKVGAGNTAPTFYFLDAHFLGGADFGLTTYAESARDPGSFPLLDEFDILLEGDLSHSVIVMDDVRMYFDGAFQNGECPEFARRWNEQPALLARIERLKDTHASYLLRDDEGYLVLAPKHLALDRKTWLNIRPQDSSGNLQYRADVVPGVTAISIQRRLADSRFATRWFRGYGVDVGGGIDSLALYKEFFPLVRNLFVYDQPHGDAQKLDNILDDSFDFLYSSHCLEHVRDASEALGNWLRVVKPGGHLVINVPDEDLYEQGQWPSRFNSDHKISFTIAKQKSWSPVSVNLLDLLGSFRDRAEVVSLQVIDQGYRYTTLPRGVDQTRTPMAECAIEFVLRKRAAAAQPVASPPAANAGVIPDQQYYKPVFSPWLGYAGFDKVMAKITPHTLVSRDRVWVLRSLAEQALREPGDFWECGVYKGGTAIMLADLIKNAPEKSLHLFDTFAGMPPTDPQRDLHREGDFADNDIKAVQQRVGVSAQIAYHAGIIPATFAGMEQARIALAHVDVDIYQAILDCCEFIYPRLCNGGFMVFDDYGFPSCPGARAAVDTFFADKPECPLVLPTGQAIVFKISVDTTCD